LAKPWPRSWRKERKNRGVKLKVKVKCKLCDYSFDLEKAMKQVREGMSRDSKMRKFLEDMADSMEEAGLDSEELVTEVRRRMPKGLLKQVMIDILKRSIVNCGEIS